MARYAIIKTDETPNRVVNAVEWDGVKPWSPPPNRIAVQTDTAGIDWTYDGATFTPPVPGPPPPNFYTAEEAEAVVDGVTNLAEAKVILRRVVRALANRILKP